MLPYFVSPNLFELTEIAKYEGSLNQVFPVVLPDAGIFDMKTRLGYIKHWEQEMDELAEAITDVDPANLQGIRKEFDLYTEIRAKIADIVDLLGNMNVMRSDVHEEEGFETLFQAIVAQVLEKDN